MTAPEQLYVVVSQPCAEGDCACLEKDGASVADVGPPPFHHLCTCTAVRDRPPIRLRAEVSMGIGGGNAIKKLPTAIRLEGLAFALWRISPSTGGGGTLEMFRKISPLQCKYWTHEAEALEREFGDYIKLIGGRKP